MFPTLHIVTDDRILARADFRSAATSILQSLEGRVALHLRARRLPAADLYYLAESLCALGATSPVLVNDRVDIAAAVSAGGVELGARSLSIPAARALLGPAAVIGYSAHSPAEAARAEADGANFLLLGTIYQSESHPELVPAGPALIESTAHRCRIPIIAIGGVTLERVPELHTAGAAGVAVIRAVWGADNPVQAAHEFAKLLKLYDSGREELENDSRNN